MLKRRDNTGKRALTLLMMALSNDFFSMIESRTSAKHFWISWISRYKEERIYLDKLKIQGFKIKRLKL